MHRCKAYWSGFTLSFFTGKLTLVARIGLQSSCLIHGVGIAFAYILHTCLYAYGYLSTITFLLMLIPAPIGLRQVSINIKLFSTVVATFNVIFTITQLNISFFVPNT